MYDKILRRIRRTGRGKLFVVSDFLDIASRQVIRCHLLRMEQREILRHVIRGVYEYPNYSEFLEEYIAPNPHSVADAIARSNRWVIVSCGDAVLNLLGLSTQVPANWCFISSGPYKTYRYGKVVLQFKHTANRDITNMSRKSLEVVQAIKTLGRENLTPEVIAGFRAVLDTNERKTLLAETLYITEWICETIRTICGKDSIINEKYSEKVGV